MRVPPRIQPARRGRFMQRVQKVTQLAQPTVKTIMTNAAQFNQKLQSPASLVKMGTEQCADIKIQAEDLVDGDFGIAYSQAFNPADPGFMSGLAAVANQYQQYRLAGLKFSFTPSATTNTNGLIHMCFLPNVTDSDPQCSRNVHHDGL